MNNKNYSIDIYNTGLGFNQDLLRQPYTISSLKFHSDTFLNEQTLYGSIPLSKVLYNKKLYNILVNKPKIIDEINSNGYRSEEFKNKHDNTHILFNGCSQTWGIGLLQNEIWSKKLYNLISCNIKTSGYFNLAVPGSSLCNQIIDIFKYCKTYGIPNFIFLNFPPMGRMYAYDKYNNHYIDASYSQNSFYLFNIIEFQYYFMLQEYCEKNKIKLFTFSWGDFENSNFGLINDLWSNGKESLLKNLSKYIYNFNSYYKINSIDLFNFIQSYKEKYKNDKYFELARDNAHFGTAYHEYWSQFMYDKYINI